MKIKAITIWQPWASLIAERYKQYETRGFPFRGCGPLAIHAAKVDPMKHVGLFTKPVLRRIARLLGPFGDLPRGAVVGVARQVVSHHVADIIVENSEHDVGDFSPGRHAWEMRDIMEFVHPYQATGRQGIWYWDLPRGLEVELES